MKTLKICVVFGTRPEVIKLGPIISELKQDSRVEMSCINTGQHRTLSDPLISLFQIDVKHSLNLMIPNQSLSALTSRTLLALEMCFQEEKPDLVVVQGDTTSAFCAGLVAYYQNIPIAHVEAGMRTFDRRHPFPEEFNRYALGHISGWHFCPTEDEANNLRDEKCDPSTIFVVGNTVVDALFQILEKSEVFEANPSEVNAILDSAKTRKLVLVTTHRRENFGKPFSDICTAVLELAKKNRDAFFVFVSHPNQRWESFDPKRMENEENILLHPPFNYLEFVQIMRAAHCILTDSGGIQEEASVLGVPVLILRKKTERVQGVRAGVAKIVGTETKDIVTEAQALIDHIDKKALEKAKLFYGEGDAAQKIVKVLLDHNLSEQSPNDRLEA